MKYPEEWSIVPIPKNGKWPSQLKDWQKIRIDRAELRKWEGNFGLVCGGMSDGLIMIDWDFRHGRKISGFKVVRDEYEKMFPELLSTLICSTPHGYHFYYRIAGHELGNKQLHNGGYSSTLKKLYSVNQVRFGKYMAGLDIRGKGGQGVIPPSVVNKLKYEWVDDSIKPLDITEEQFQQILNFFEEKEPGNHTMRQGFIDILEGDVDPNKIGTKDCPEQVYWQEMYHEACSCWGVVPEDLYAGLAKHNKGFDLEKTKVQIANKKKIDYIMNGKRLGTTKYNKYFPQYDRAKPVQETTDIFGGDSDVVDNDEDVVIIPYDSGEIHVYDTHTLYVHTKGKNIIIEKMLDCSFKIFSKCKYQKKTRYSYLLNDEYFQTSTILEILDKTKAHIRKGQRGQDCIKEIINYHDKKINFTKAKNFLGFDNGWNLPQTEDEKNISLIVITDYQQDAYERASKMLADYSDKQKEKITTDLKEFIKITQCEMINLAILIGWTVASCFRLFFVKEYDLFPILYNYGLPNTGRSSLEDFWIVNFYDIYESHLPPNTSGPRLEDHLSKSIFPQSLQDIKEANLYANKELLGMLLDYSTSVGLFERKKDSKRIDFIKYKIAGLNLDSNDILASFSNPAINERQIFVHYKLKTELDLEWVRLRKKLRKIKLFSFIYDYTKEWSNKELEELYGNILERFTTKFEVNSTRLLKSGAIIKFGLEIFAKAFNFKLNIEDQAIIKSITEGSTKMTEGIVDQFRDFCSIAINYNETTQTIKEYANGESYPQINRGENPKYLNHRLQMDSENKYYAYTSRNHEDYKKRYSERCGLKSLVEKIQKGLDMKESKLIEAVSARPFRENGVKCKPMGIIKINPQFIIEKEGIDGDILTLDEVFE